MPHKQVFEVSPPRVNLARSPRASPNPHEQWLPRCPTWWILHLAQNVVKIPAVMYRFFFIQPSYRGNITIWNSTSGQHAFAPTYCIVIRSCGPQLGWMKKQFEIPRECSLPVRGVLGPLTRRLKLALRCTGWKNRAHLDQIPTRLV